MALRSGFGIIVGLALATVACSSGEPSQEPPVEDNAVRYEMTTTIEAGAEVEHCMFVRAPPEGILLNRDEIHYTEGSHHFLLYSTLYDEIPNKTNAGQPIKWVDEAAGIFDCSEGVQFEFDAYTIIAGSQNANGDSVIDFPSNVALRVEPNTVLLMNAHYINTSSQPITPNVHVALHQIDEEEMDHEGGLLFFFDIFVKVPMQGSAHSTMLCDIDKDITVTNAQSHMHARGVGFDAVAITPDGERDMYYTTTEWEDVPVAAFDGGMALQAGTRIEHTCRYENNEAREIFMGPRSTDEMCVMIASYYPADPYTSLCSGRSDEPTTTNFMGAEWIGQGSATCSESLDCFSQATSMGGGIFQIVSYVTECVMASDPAVSRELSDAIGCSFSSFITGNNPLDDCSDAYATCVAM